MARLRLKFVQSFGGFHYFRRRGSPRIRLPGLVGSAEFMTTYQAALAAAPVPIGASKRSKPGSISSAIAEYYGSQSFRSLGGGTPAKWRANLERFRERHGHMPLASLPKEFIVALLDTMPPHAALNLLKTFRHFFRWCLTRNLVRNDPTSGIHLKMPKVGRIPHMDRR
jgi:hypothetical protein